LANLEGNSRHPCGASDHYRIATDRVDHLSGLYL
jgi:hypothetical protein